MSKEEIADRIKSFLEEEFPGEGVALTRTTNLLNDWFMDSFGIINTVLFLESAFKIKLSRADINGAAFESIDSLTELVAGRMAPSSSV